MTHANAMGDFVGAHIPVRPNMSRVCPDCLGLMSHNATLCVDCSAKRTAEKLREKGAYSPRTMDRHRRWTALLALGFTNRELMRLRPFVFSWEEIEQFEMEEKE